MTDTQRSKSTLLTALFQDGQAAGSITPQDARDLIISLTLPYMGLSVTTPVETVISVQSTYVKALGTTTVTNKSSDMDDNSANNRIRYTGVSPRHFHVVAHCSITMASGTNQNVGLQIWYWDDSASSGSLLAHSEAQSTFASTVVDQLVAQGDVIMDTNDYLEMHVTNHTGTVNLTLDLGYFFAKGTLL